MSWLDSMQQLLKKLFLVCLFSPSIVAFCVRKFSVEIFPRMKSYVGWENAKAEAMSLQYEIDAVLEQKEAAEVRVFHLDGALKECKQQLRQVREEQEEAIHEAVLKRSRQWDEMKSDLEERLADAERRLIDFENQKALLHRTDEERADAVAELGRVRSDSEAQIKKLEMQVQTLDKQNTSLKYEIVVLNKELSIRNQEREMNNRALDRANQQHAENSKRIAKLENECQRLRSLVRKKLPGPGALMQMKLEAGTEAERTDGRGKRRSNAKASISPKAAHSEFLSSKDLCSQSTDKLLREEDQVGPLQRSPRITFTGPRSHIDRTRLSVSEDGNDDDDQSVAESWASGITLEAAYVHREHLQQADDNHSVVSFETLNSIDDFLEIERLVALPSDKEKTKTISKPEQTLSNISEDVFVKDVALRDGDVKICTELSDQQEQLNQLSSRINMLSEHNFFSLQRRIIAILENPEKKEPEMIFKKLKRVVIASKCATINGEQAAQGSSQPGDAERKINSILPSNCSNFEKTSHTEPWISKVICVVEEIASKIIIDNRERQTGGGNRHNGKQSKAELPLSELETSLKSFNATGNAYLFGKAELVQFMAALYSVLNHLNTSILAHKPFNVRLKWRPESAQVAEQEVLSDVGSPFSLSGSSDHSDSILRKDLSADERFANRKLKAVNEFSRMGSSSEVIVRLKQEKSELQRRLREETDKFNAVKDQLGASEKLVASFRARLAAAQLSLVSENNSLSFSAMKAQEDSLHEDIQQKKLEGNRELKNEQLQTQCDGSGTFQSVTPRFSSGNIQNGDKGHLQIADATEKLAECQRTILVLGQQLKDIASTNDGDLSHINESHRAAHSTLESVLSTLKKGDLGSLTHFEVNSASEVSSEETLFTTSTTSRTKPILQLFAAAMSKPLNPEAAPISRKHTNSLSKLFQRHKGPS
ncbi:hypothetical protein KP509_27G014900 [Ceratopteris richardii]|uniref:Filament-like plant protein 7 n=1 Tax=Ceratopteris richardii TaxID=49495 RepID=A0A8T2RGN3_CERRI|nr:hypothetical protein KP509_27G014900 [Ceratopteris richardii]